MTGPVSAALLLEELAKRRTVDSALRVDINTALVAANHRTDFSHGAFMASLRQLRGKVPSSLYDDIMVAINVGMGKSAPATVKSAAQEPSWLTEARKHLGMREIVGVKHNPVIVGFWKMLGRPYDDDETPWCGGFVGYCMAKSGNALPSFPERAFSWAMWGQPCAPTVGAIGVKTRQGGNHVFFIVGETPDRQFYKALGGNQGNRVSIMDIRKSDTFAVRWPSKLSPSIALGLPKLAPGTVSSNEA